MTRIYLSRSSIAVKTEGRNKGYFQDIKALRMADQITTIRALILN